MKLACLHNLSSDVEEWMHSVDEDMFRRYLFQVTGQVVLSGTDFQSSHRQHCRSFMKSTSITAPSLSDCCPLRFEWLRASLSALNCQQHKQLFRIHVELYSLIHERILLSAVVFVRVENREGKSFSFLRIHHAPHTNEKFRVRFSSSLFCSNGNAIEAFKGFAPFRMEAGRQEGREHDDDCGVEDEARKTRFRKIFMRSKEKEILQPHRKAYDKQFRYTNTGRGRRRGAIREAKLRSTLIMASIN